MGLVGGVITFNNEAEDVEHIFAIIFLLAGISGVLVVAMCPDYSDLLVRDAGDCPFRLCILSENCQILKGKGERDCNNNLRLKQIKWNVRRSPITNTMRSVS